MTLEDELKTLAFQTASEAYLTTRIPDSWESLTDLEQASYLKYNAWEKIEQYSSVYIYGLIEAHAYTIFESYKTILRT